MDRLYLKSEISLSGDLYEVIAFDINEDTFAVAIYTEAEVDDSVHWTNVYEKHYPTRKQAMRAFVSTKVNVLSAEYHLNRNHVIGGMYTPLSMWYDFLGIVINNADTGKLYWYLCDSYSWIDFTHRAEKTKNGETIYKIGMLFDPMPEEYWEEYY